jgi:hypothetical protein
MILIQNQNKDKNTLYGRFPVLKDQLKIARILKRWLKDTTDYNFPDPDCPD